MGDFLKFKKMITPTIMQVLFWVGVVVAIIGGLGHCNFQFLSGRG